MKYSILIIFGFIILINSGCKKSYVGDTYDFSNSLAPYVELASKSPVKAKQGTVIKVTVQMKTALTEDVTVSYAITSVGSTPINGTVIILRNTVKAIGSITLPGGIVTTGSTLAAQLALTGATKGNNNLRVGSIVPTSEIINITITP